MRVDAQSRLGRKTVTRGFETVFAGSFFETEKLPKDRRPHIALAGRSNVGKSSLLNRLVGRKKLAKVSSTPGKTRSINLFMVNEQFYLVDLPGYGFARVAKSVKANWQKLIEEYLTTSPNLTGLALLLDCRREPTAEDEQLLAWLAARELPALVVLTKVDKLTRDKINRKVHKVERELGVSVIPTSATTGIGKSDLVKAIVDLVGDSSRK